MVVRASSLFINLSFVSVRLLVGWMDMDGWSLDTYRTADVGCWLLAVGLESENENENEWMRYERRESSLLSESGVFGVGYQSRMWCCGLTDVQGRTRGMKYVGRRDYVASRLDLPISALAKVRGIVRRTLISRFVFLGVVHV